VNKGGSLHGFNLLAKDRKSMRWFAIFFQEIEVHPVHFLEDSAVARSALVAVDCFGRQMNPAAVPLRN